MMRLRILVTFLGLALFVTACNNSKKHDNTDAFDLEQQQEAMTRQTQNILKENLLDCSFVNNPNQDRVNCPALTEHRYTKNFPNIPNCGGVVRLNNKCNRLTDPVDTGTKDFIKDEVADISIEAAYPYEVIPVRITDKDACYVGSKFFEDEDIIGLIGETEEYNCDGVLLKNVAGLTNGGGTGGTKKYFGHIIIAPISPNSAPAATFAKRLELAFGHISPSQAIELQQPRYGRRSFNPGNFSEGYAYVTSMTIKNVRYSMRKAGLIDLRNGQPFQFTTPRPMFAYAKVHLKYGYDFRNYNQANIGVLTPNFLTEEEFKIYVLNNNQEQQERYSRQID